MLCGVSYIYYTLCDMYFTVYYVLRKFVQKQGLDAKLD